MSAKKSHVQAHLMADGGWVVGMGCGQLIVVVVTFGVYVGSLSSMSPLENYVQANDGGGLFRGDPTVPPPPLPIIPTIPQAPLPIPTIPQPSPGPIPSGVPFFVQNTLGIPLQITAIGVDGNIHSQGTVESRQTAQVSPSFNDVARIQATTVGQQAVRTVSCILPTDPQAGSTQETWVLLPLNGLKLTRLIPGTTTLGVPQITCV